MIVGLTGGIGSGKTIVSELFSVLGCIVYNSDVRAKEMYYLPEVKQKVISVLGKEAYYYDGKINRDFISLKIFNDSSLLEKINTIIHPAVINDFNFFLKDHSSDKIIIKESALLFESGIDKQMDKSILVTAPLEIKIQRLQKRDGASAEQIKARINSQDPDDEKLTKSDFVIVNDEIHGLIPQVLAIYKKLKNA